MNYSLVVEELGADKLNDANAKIFRELLIQDWEQVNGVDARTAHEIIEQHEIYRSTKAMRHMIGSTATRFCLVKGVYPYEPKHVAAAMIGERKYGDEAGYVSSPFDQALYQAVRLRHGAHRAFCGSDPPASEASLFGWGALIGYGAAALEAIAGWSESNFPETDRLVIDVDTGDDNLKESVKAVSGKALDPNAQVGSITLGGDQQIVRHFQRAVIPYEALNTRRRAG